MEYLFRCPAFSTTCVYALYGVFTVSMLSLSSCRALIVTFRTGCLKRALLLENVDINSRCAPCLGVRVDTEQRPNRSIPARDFCLVHARRFPQLWFETPKHARCVQACRLGADCRVWVSQLGRRTWVRCWEAVRSAQQLHAVDVFGGVWFWHQCVRIACTASSGGWFSVRASSCPDGWYSAPTLDIRTPTIPCLKSVIW